MKNPILKFCIKITSVLLAQFVIHVFFLNVLTFPLFENKIVLSYLVNLLLAILTYAVLITLSKTKQSSLGFIFMGGSFIKFVVFFILFYPHYKSDGVMSRLEFIAFFAPYAISLTLEVLEFIKILNETETEKP